MKIKITGSTGYLGKIITGELKAKGHTVSGIERKYLYGSVEELKNVLSETDVLINLAGAPILQRWTEHNKEIIYNSRVKTIQNLTKAINELPPGDRPKKIISASAIGIYATGKSHDEESRNFDEGFVGKVVKDWESAWEGLPDSMPLTVFRIGLVLGKNAATIKKLMIPFKMGVGGKIGNGKQPFPFVHEKDVARAFLWATENRSKTGVYNLAAPQKISNSTFTKAFAKALNKPAFIPVPEFALQVVFGKAAVLITESPEVEPKALKAEGFTFKYPTIESTFAEILK